MMVMKETSLIIFLHFGYVVNTFSVRISCS